MVNNHYSVAENPVIQRRLLRRKLSLGDLQSEIPSETFNDAWTVDRLNESPSLCEITTRKMPFGRSLSSGNLTDMQDCSSFVQAPASGTNLRNRRVIASTLKAPLSMRRVGSAGGLDEMMSSYADRGKSPKRLIMVVKSELGSAGLSSQGGDAPTKKRAGSVTRMEGEEKTNRTLPRRGSLRLLDDKPSEGTPLTRPLKTASSREKVEMKASDVISKTKLDPQLQEEYFIAWLAKHKEKDERMERVFQGFVESQSADNHDRDLPCSEDSSSKTRKSSRGLQDKSPNRSGDSRIPTRDRGYSETTSGANKSSRPRSSERRRKTTDDHLSSSNDQSVARRQPKLDTLARSDQSLGSSVESGSIQSHATASRRNRSRDPATTRRNRVRDPLSRSDHGLGSTGDGSKIASSTARRRRIRGDASSCSGSDDSLCSQGGGSETAPATTTRRTRIRDPLSRSDHIPENNEEKRNTAHVWNRRKTKKADSTSGSLDQLLAGLKGAGSDCMEEE